MKIVEELYSTDPRLNRDKDIYIFISQRARNLSYDLLKKDSMRIYGAFLTSLASSIPVNNCHLIDSLNKEYEKGKSNPVEFLGKSISAMSKADIVLIPIDAEKSHGCKIELSVAEEYNIPVFVYLTTSSGKIFFIRLTGPYHVNTESILRKGIIRTISENIYALHDVEDRPDVE